MFRIAIFPGSFDPFTIGHADIVRRALPLFDKIIIGIGQNAAKQPLYPLDRRIANIKRVFADTPQIEVATYDNLTIDFARKHNAQFIIRGIRTTTDYEYEQSIATANRLLAGLETVILFTKPEYQHISSTLVRDLHNHGYDITPFLP